MKWIVPVLMLFLVIALVPASDYNFYLMKGQADNLYCKLSDGCSGGSSAISNMFTVDVSNCLEEICAINASASAEDMFVIQGSPGTMYLWRNQP